MILIQIKVFDRFIKETTLARHFIKVTARPSFTRLGVISRINRAYWISKWKTSYKDSIASPSYLKLLGIITLYKISKKRYAVGYTRNTPVHPT